MTEEISFGRWLRQQRRLMDLTQQAFAEQVGCARITLRRIEADLLKPSRELALILLEKTGIPTAEREPWVRFARGQGKMPLAAEAVSRSQPRTNLPALLTSFIGREKERAEIMGILEKQRLVSLVGPGGVGKTRLSLKVGEQLLATFADGVWLIELASLNNPELLPQTLASIFGLAPMPNVPVIDTAIHFLHPKEMLLLFDNCEHLLDASAQLAGTLLKYCPGLKILATSREALGMMGEAIYQVPALGVPGADKLLDVYRESESVRLFEERAQLALMDFTLTMENAAAVAQICTRLDGIPLAIELAAVQVNLLLPGEIANQLERCFDVLAGGNRTALPRQQTIRASVDWSWDLLTDTEQALLRRLSVFAGGWTRASARAVCENGFLKSQAIDKLLGQLVRKSLVAVNQVLGHETRYSFHEIVRQYAREKLAETNEEASVHQRHLQYFRQFSEEAEIALQGPEQVAWGERLTAEGDNIRAALAWADQTGEVEAGLFISGRLMERFWFDFNMREGERWLGMFLEKPGAHLFPQAQAKALCAYGFYAHRTQQGELMRKKAEECLALYRSIGDPYGETDSLIMLARHYRPKNRAQSIEFCQKALVLAESLGDLWRKAIALSRLGWCYDYSQGISYWQEAISLFRQVGDLLLLLDALSTLAGFEITAGALAAAEAHLNEAIQVSQVLNHKGGVVYIHLSRMEAVKGNFENASAILEKGIAEAEERGHRMNYLTGLANLGHLFVYQGQFAAARDIFLKAIQELYEDRSKIGVCYSLEGIAGFYAAIDRPAIAARLIGWANTVREEIKLERPILERANVEKSMAACVAAMGEVAFTEAYEMGQKMTFQEAVALALTTAQDTN